MTLPLMEQTAVDRIPAAPVPLHPDAGQTVARAADAGAAPAAEDWVVECRDGLRLHVPASLRSLTTYVLLEQEAWFEPEMSLLPHLLADGGHALDIGANHGVVALAMARAGGDNQVLAFEPTAAPRQRLLRSVSANGLQSRVHVWPCALGERPGSARFAVQANSELNRRAAFADALADERQVLETVAVQTLDEVMRSPEVRERLDGRPVALVKLDAEGDELRVLAGARRFFAEHSPVVWFEFKHGDQYNTSLLDAFNGLGYGIYRWSDPLQMLLPFDPARAELPFALNLVAVRKPQQQALQDRGLLATPGALAEALDTLEAGPPADGPAGDAVMEVLANAMAAAERAHSDRQASAAQRAALMVAARERLLQASHAGHDLPAVGWVLLVHALFALGQPLAALQMASRLLQAWPEDLEVRGPVMPPLRQQATRTQTTATGPWLRQMVAEFVALQGSFSSYFEKPAPGRWLALLAHPDHGAEIERRCLLSHVLADLPAPLERLHHLGAGRPACNATLWRGLMDAMRAVHRATQLGRAEGRAEPPLPTAGGAGPAPASAALPATSAPATPPAAAAVRASAAAVLAELPAAVQVAVVDVGAAPLAGEAEPYAPLLRTGRAHVTAFEPDARALEALRQRWSAPGEPSGAHAASHRFLPHWVGDGRPATFHATAWSLTSSLLPPRRDRLDRWQRLGELVQETGRHPVQTVRLDDVIDAGGMQLLKIDVQGAEGMVFAGAPQRLSECLMVWTEVEFVPLYEGQPLFAEIDQQLRAHGLQFLCFAGLAPRCLASWPLQGQRPPLRQQQLWADALYVPSPERIAALEATPAAQLALLAHHVAGAFDLCHAALLRHDELTGSGFAASYLQSLAA